jgi:hypothetical protein
MKMIITEELNLEIQLLLLLQLIIFPMKTVLDHKFLLLTIVKQRARNSGDHFWSVSF